MDFESLLYRIFINLKCINEYFKNIFHDILVHNVNPYLTNHH